jgi:hypothetical protein
MTAVAIFVVLGVVAGAFLVWYSIRSTPDYKTREAAFLKLQSKLDKSMSELDEKGGQFNRLLAEAEEALDLLKLKVEAAEDMLKKMAQLDDMVKNFTSSLTFKEEKLKETFNQMMAATQNLENFVETASASIANKVKTFLQSQSGFRGQSRLEDEIEITSQKYDNQISKEPKDSLRSDPRLGVLGAR